MQIASNILVSSRLANTEEQSNDSKWGNDSSPSILRTRCGIVDTAIRSKSGVKSQIKKKDVPFVWIPFSW